MRSEDRSFRSFSMRTFCMFVVAVSSLMAQLSATAQIADDEYKKLLERDKSVPKEKVEKAFAEARKIHDEIFRAMRDKMPDFKLKDSRFNHLRSGNSLTYSSTPGRLGTTLNEISWTKKETGIFLNFILGFDKNDTLLKLRQSMSAISMGEFFDVPNLGDEATLVKNVAYNKSMTSVSIHFVKGRASVSIYLTNHRRRTEKNEKELMEIVGIIEPLVVARPNFDDLDAQ